PGQVTTLVVAERVEPAAGDHGPYPRIVGRGEQRVVAAQGVPHRQHTARVDPGQRQQQVDPPHVVADRLHGATAVPEGGEVRLVPAHRRVARRQHHVTGTDQPYGVVAMTFGVRVDHH